MIGRFLGTDVPATGFSIGFERLVDLIEVPPTMTADAIVLVYDAACRSTACSPSRPS